MSAKKVTEENNKCVQDVYDEFSELEIDTTIIAAEVSQMAEKCAQIFQDHEMKYSLKMSPGEKCDIDLGNVNYSTSKEQLAQHFQDCGKVLRVTIPLDKYRMTPKGFAFIEFDTKEAMEAALIKNRTILNGRALVVKRKRKNIRGYSTTDRPLSRRCDLVRGVGPKRSSRRWRNLNRSRPGAPS